MEKIKIGAQVRKQDKKPYKIPYKIQVMFLIFPTNYGIINGKAR